MQWIRSRLTFLQYISLHIIIGLVISFVCLAVFAELADEVIDQEWVVPYDYMIANTFHANATPLATAFFLTVTRFGLEAIWVIAFTLGAYLAYNRRWDYLLMLIITIVGGELLNGALKLFFARPRPTFENPIITALNYSFPSGHAMLSFIAYGLLAYFVVIKTPGRPRKLLIMTAAGLMIGLIGLSRIYLGVHYFSDVVAGYAAGGVWLSTCITALNFLLPIRCTNVDNGQ